MISIEQLEGCTEKQFSRSSGPGGQNVNKTETRVQLQFHIAQAPLSEKEKSRLFEKYPEGFIAIQTQETRSQSQNLKIAFERLHEQIIEDLKVEAPRKQTKAPHQTKSGKWKKMIKDKWLKYKRRYMDH